MGTGVGEAMLIGAVTGAGTSAVTGGDPLKGAMFGALGGGVTSGIGGALGGSSGAASGATAATTTPALSSAGATAIPAGSAGTASMTSGGFGNTIGSALNPTTSGAVGTFGNVGAGGFGSATLPGTAAGSGASGVAAGAPAASIPSSFDLRNLPSTGDLLSRKDEIQTGGSALANLIGKYPMGAPAVGGAFANMIFNQPTVDMPGDYEGPLKRFRYDPSRYRPAYAKGGLADGGIADLNIVDPGIAGTEGGMYPQSQIDKTQYATPSQMPTSAEVITSDYSPRVNPYTDQAMASGGIADLGSYSDGGRLLKGPGDGMSDSIPAKIGRKQPARLADGEFVVPADVVSHLGNGSTDAGAKQLYSMMDKVRRARTGNKKQGKEINPRKFIPA